ncbi:MAG: MlaD family protein [Saprospiraceae bacterium]
MLKINNEMKVALLAIIAISLGFWGFKFLKGVNVLSSTKTLYVRYSQVDQLRPSNPVLLSGFQVGLVQDMYIDKEDGKSIIVAINLNSGVEVHKNTRAIIVGTGLMGGKAIVLETPGPCQGPDCARHKDWLQGQTKSFIESLVGDPAQIDAYTERLRIGLTSVYDSIADPNDPQGLGRSLVALERTLLHLEKITDRIDRIAQSNEASISRTMNSVAGITANLNAREKDINAIIANLGDLSAQLKNAGIDQGAQTAIRTLDSLTLSLSALRATLNTTRQSMTRIDTLAQNLAAGKGSAGKILTDEEFYENLTRTTRHLQLLLQDLRLHPKRYNTVKLKIFGKNKTPGYEIPYDDPAYLRLLDSLERDYSRRVRIGQ